MSARASDALLQWLKRHGTGLRSLTVHRGSLHRNWQYNSLPDLHQLTRLELKNMTEQPKLLGAVGSCMKSLVHLSLDNVYFNPLVDASLSVEASKLLAGCSRLTYLQVTSGTQSPPATVQAA